MKGFQRTFRALVLVSALSVTALAGCGSSGADTGAGELRVFNWGEYLDPEVIKGFESETGIKVIYEEFETNEVMYAKLAQDPAAYDVLCPSDYMISKLI
ncbi:MAG: spermidine/putrescine ABC transporter substrate-binding protein, partial [Lachnospiraceae bacterium]|nr:spermidine/putrescine ABC transporter substrate-binding protein [Lachnospiraceae bacterium]